MKAEELDKFFFRYGQLHLIYIDGIEKAYVENTNINEDGLRKQIIIRDTYNEQQNNGIAGTTLVNFLNKSDEIKKILKEDIRFLEECSVEKLNDFLIDENITYSFYLDETINHFKDKLIKKIKCIPLEIIISNQFYTFQKNNIEYSSLSWFDFFKKYEENKKNNIYFKNMYNYFISICNKTVEKSRWFEKFSKTEMIKIFLGSLIEEIEYIESNAKKDIEKYPHYSTKDNCIIPTLTHLFYVSKYHLKKKNGKTNKHIIRNCEICNKYFITKSSSNEHYCRRKYRKRIYTCHDYGSTNVRSDISINYGKHISKTKELKRKVSKIKNRIKINLGKNDKKHNTNTKEEFLQWLKIEETRLSTLDEKEDILLQKLIDNMEEIYEELRINGKKND